MDSTENSISVKFVNRDLLTFSYFFNKRMALVVLKAAFLHLKVRYEAFFNIGRFRPLFRLFSSSSHSNSNFNIINWKNCRCLLGIRTLGRRVIDADETTELCTKHNWQRGQFRQWMVRDPSSNHRHLLFYLNHRLFFQSLRLPFKKLFKRGTKRAPF